MKKYLDAELEVIKFSAQDVIATSSEGDPDEGPLA